MSLARRVRAGIALHAGVNVVFAAVAALGATGGSVAAVASEGTSTAGVVASPRRAATHADAHPLLGAATPVTVAVNAPPTEAELVLATATPTTTAQRDASSATTTTSSPSPAAATASDVPDGHRRVVSTGYCLSGTTASGRQVSDGMAAMNDVPLGTQWLVHDGPRSGSVFEVTDRIGRGTEFDIWFADCDDARAYGRRTILIEQVA